MDKEQVAAQDMVETVAEVDATGPTLVAGRLASRTATIEQVLGRVGDPQGHRAVGSPDEGLARGERPLRRDRPWERRAVTAAAHCSSVCR